MRSVVLFLVGASQLMAACAGRMQDWPNVRPAIRAAEPVVAALQEHRNVTGKYPESLRDLKLPEDVVARLNEQRVKYSVREAGAVYSLAFNPTGGFPAFCATGSGRAGNWECMGK